MQMPHAKEETVPIGVFVIQDFMEMVGIVNHCAVVRYQ